MSRQKQTVVSFRVDQHLAEALNNLPDKSTFIREAILRRFHTVCPFCKGRGVMPQMIADHLTQRLPDEETVECSCCHYAYPLALVQEQVAEADGTAFVCPHCADHDHMH